MGFFAMCLAGYKIVAFITLLFIGLLAAAVPVLMVLDLESPLPIALYIITVPIAAACIKLMGLL